MSTFEHIVLTVIVMVVVWLKCVGYLAVFLGVRNVLRAWLDRPIPKVWNTAWKYLKLFKFPFLSNEEWAGIFKRM